MVLLSFEFFSIIQNFINSYSSSSNKLKHQSIQSVCRPEDDGELFKQLQSLYPNIKVLYMSACTADVIGHRGVMAKDVCFIPKSYSKKMWQKQLEGFFESKMRTSTEIS